ncbi:MAG: class II fructose-bisphosphate aldolase [Candidatus Altiarchaeota archaeon]
MTSDYKPISGKLIFDSLRDMNCIVMAANIRMLPSIEGIMQAATEKRATLLFEIAKSEIGYTGLAPAEYYESITRKASELGFDIPYAIHADHITVKSPGEADVQSAEDLIKAELSAGFTSFAIDASHIYDTEGESVAERLAGNIDVTTKLAKLIPKEFSLEVEVGEIGKKDPKTGKQELTTVEEAVTFIEALQANGIEPDLIATHNGSTHGNIYDAEGNVIEQVGIDEQRTRDIAKAIKHLGVQIAQHGITGTPLNLMHRLIDAGIAKGNVATNWQNIAIDSFPKDLNEKMKSWTMASEQVAAMRQKKPNMSDGEILGKNIKHAIKVHKDLIAQLTPDQQAKVTKATKESAMAFFEAFNAVGSADAVKL